MVYLKEICAYIYIYMYIYIYIYMMWWCQCCSRSSISLIQGYHRNFCVWPHKQIQIKHNVRAYMEYRSGRDWLQCTPCFVGLHGDRALLELVTESTLQVPVFHRFATLLQLGSRFLLTVTRSNGFCLALAFLFRKYERRQDIQRQENEGIDCLILTWRELKVCIAKSMHMHDAWGVGHKIMWFIEMLCKLCMP